MDVKDERQLLPVGRTDWLGNETVHDCAVLRGEGDVVGTGDLYVLHPGVVLMRQPPQVALFEREHLVGLLRRRRRDREGRAGLRIAGDYPAAGCQRNHRSTGRWNLAHIVDAIVFHDQEN